MGAINISHLGIIFEEITKNCQNRRQKMSLKLFYCVWFLNNTSDYKHLGVEEFGMKFAIQ